MLLTQLPDFCQGLQAYQLGSGLRENMSVCSFPLNRFRVFVNPLDLLIPPVYSVPVMELREVTHPPCLVPIRWGEAEAMSLPRRTHGCPHVRALLHSAQGLGPAVWDCPGGWDLTQGQAAFVPLPSLSQACTGTIPIFIQRRGLPVNPRDLTSRQMWGTGGRDTNAPLCAFCSALPVSFSCRQTARFVACKASPSY